MLKEGTFSGSHGRQPEELRQSGKADGRCEVNRGSILRAVPELREQIPQYASNTKQEKTRPEGESNTRQATQKCPKPNKRKQERTFLQEI